MIRKLLATTALVSALATGAYAQDAAAPAQTAPAQTAPAATAPTGNDAMQSGDTNAASADAGGYVQRLEDDQYLVSDLTGTDLYESADPNAKSVGEIQNFVVGKDGKVEAVVISTSNLDQNKTVAAPVDKIDWGQADSNNEPRAILKASADELNGAPAFNDQSDAQAQNNGAMAPGSGAAPATGTDTSMMANNNAMNNGANPAAPAGDMAAAPADNAAPAPAGDNASASGANGYLAMLDQDQHLSDDIIGSNVYSGPGNDAQTIGSVNDLAMSKSGDIAAVVVGVGGFLGIGEKNVGVPFEKITMQPGENGGEPRMILAATKDQLNGAPTFDEGTNDNQSTAANDTSNANMATTGNTMAAGTAGMAAGTAAAPGDQTAQNAPATGGAMAPGTAAPAAGDATNADTSTTASTGGANDRSSMQPVSGPELTADNLDGVTVYGPNDESIGKVGDIALTGDGKVDAIVVDVGGFLGIGSKPVAVAMDNLQFMKDTNGTVNVYTQFTKDQLNNAPEFNRETYAENRSSMRLESGNAPAPAGDASNSANDTNANQPAAQ